VKTEFESEFENSENVKKQAQLILDNLGNQPKILDIGCGTRKWGNIGLDLYPFEGVDIVWNVTRGLPFPDNALDGIYIYHVLEHLPHGSFETVMEEMWRCCKDNAWIEIKAPHFSGEIAFSDSTHVRPFSLTTFSHYVPEGSGSHFGFYRKYRFKVDKIRLNFFSFPEDRKKDYREKGSKVGLLKCLIGDIIGRFANINFSAQRFCERIWCYWVGGFDEVDVKLVVIK
jgi:ubiquinone/menaquinone biosynthesis C-methylase UbiE